MPQRTPSLLAAVLVLFAPHQRSRQDCPFLRCTIAFLIRAKARNRSYTRGLCGRGSPIDRFTEAPEVKEALTKAEEYANLAALAKTGKNRYYYERMRHKWLGIAEGWRVITSVDDARGGASGNLGPR
jgi:hypothetical protein